MSELMSMLDRRVDQAQMRAQPYLDKLAAFDTAEEIRKFLVDEEIMARPGHANSCAIAVYVQRGSGLPIHVSRYRTAISGWNPFFAHTRAMREFIANFDSGMYLELTGWLPPEPPASSGADFYALAGSATC